MNQTNNTIQFSQFAAVSKDSDEVLGKILYYTLSSILIDREVLARLCDTVDFPYKPIRRSSLADAFRSATGDIYHRLFWLLGLLEKNCTILSCLKSPVAWRRMRSI